MNRAFGAKTFVCVAANIPGFGQWSCDGVTAFAKSKGGESHTILVDPTAVDSNAIALQVRALHPDALDVNLFKGAAIALLAASVDSGLSSKTRFMAPTTLYSADIPKAIGHAWNDKLFVQLELEPRDKNSPDANNWRAVMDAYGNASDPRDTFSEAGYLAARITTETLLKLAPEKITRPVVSEALRNVTNFRSDLMCGPWYFGPGSHHNANHAGSISVVSGDAFASKAGCFAIEDPELADLKTIESHLHAGK
jgi:branched-chain amino acid transport system substrate-binding protein